VQILCRCIPLLLATMPTAVVLHVCLHLLISHVPRPPILIALFYSCACICLCLLSHIQPALAAHNLCRWTPQLLASMRSCACICLYSVSDFQLTSTHIS
jgi:hypothetical protein